MAKITDLTPQVKDKNRISVYVDGRFYCGMKAETVFVNRLKIGDEIEPEQLDEIQKENECSQALDKAMTHLSASMKTEQQMIDYLKKKGYVDSVCEYVLEKLREYGFVNDLQYCEEYIRTAGKSFGSRRIFMELRKRGAHDSDIESALSERTGEDDAAKVIAGKYMRNKEFTKENLSKAFRHLMSKGFDCDTAKDALAALGGDSEED